MESKEPDIEFKVYNKLTRASNGGKNSGKWTLNLLLCCLVVATGPLQFGYNISSMNSVTTILNEFIGNHTFLFAEFHNKSQVFKLNEGNIKANETALNNSTGELFNQTKNFLADEEVNVKKSTKMLWTITNSLFVIGGMIGTFSAKFIMDKAGRKAGIFMHHMFGISGGALALAAFFFNSPVCLMVSRFLFGVQGGMSCTLVPTYLAEISPAALRGRTGVIHQLCITIGIVIAQLFGLRQILGSQDLWGYLIAVPLIPALFGSITLLLFLPESPRALISRNRDEETVKKSLILLRNTRDVDEELEDLLAESKQGKTVSDENVSIIGLFKSRECQWAIITSLVIHITQQLSGINAVFYYSSLIFEDCGISKDYIQYAILSTGVVNVIATIICVPIIDSLGRKPLLIYPMIFMIIDFVCLIICLTFKESIKALSYLTVVCIILFVVSFAVGLGPIPFIYTAECFRQNARSSAMALSTFMNWSAGLVLTLIFPFMLELVQQYVFCIFAGVVAFALLVIISKVPETKGKTIEEIISRFCD